MVVPFPPLSMTSQRKNFNPSVLRLDRSLSDLCQHAFESKTWGSTFTNPEPKPSAVSIITNGSKVKHSVFDITSSRDVKQKNWLFHCLGYPRVLSGSQAFTSEDEISHAEEERLLHKMKSHDQLNMSCWSCAYHNRNILTTVSGPSYPDRNIPKLSLEKYCLTQINKITLQWTN